MSVESDSSSIISFLVFTPQLRYIFTSSHRIVVCASVSQREIPNSVSLVSNAPHSLLLSAQRPTLKSLLARDLVEFMLSKMSTA